MSSLTFQAVIFDLFRTLVDPDRFKPPQYHRTQRVARILSADSGDFAKYWAGTVKQRHTRRNETVHKLLRAYARTHGLEVPRKTLSIAVKEWGRYHDLAILRPSKNVKHFLISLRNNGVKLGLLSNADEREIRQWSHSSLAEYFDASCFSYKIGYRKPNPKSYETVLAKLELPSAVSVFVGDGEDGELEGAKKAGFGKVVFMRGIVQPHKIQTRAQMAKHEAVADATIDSLEDLAKVMGS
jgi:putative hydrolase of the HAD superfamily